jgi:hypothetical protein
MPMKKSGLFRNKNAKATPYKDKGVTEVGKEAKTQSYKEYVQKMFGGGMTEPSMKRNKMMGWWTWTPDMQQSKDNHWNCIPYGSTRTGKCTIQ